MERDDMGNRGALVPEKTFWYSVDFEWVDGEWNISVMEDTDANLTMLDAQNRVQEIKCLASDIAKETLGV